MHITKWLLLPLVVALGFAVTGPSAFATTHNLVFGAPYATASNIAYSTVQQYGGIGSWYEQYPSAKTEIYVDPAAQFGASFTIDQIQSITYRTVNDATNPSGVDFYMLIYTALEGSDNDASWYNKRINAEPYLTNGYTAPTAWVWNAWTTDAPSNQLTFFDANNCGNFGFYGAPTLADLQMGAVNWSTWPGNPTPGTSDPNPIDYGAKTVKYLNWSTGSGWASFAGYIDAIEVTLTNGDNYVIDLESKTDTTYADIAWAGSAPGVEVEPGKFFGWNAFDNVQDAIDNVAGSTVIIAPGTYEEQLEITMDDLELIGSGMGSTIIKSPTSLTKFFTTSVNNYPIIYIHDATDVSISDLTVDGAGRGNANYRFIGVGFRNAGGVLDGLEVTDIRDTPFSGAQHGVGIYAYNVDGVARSIEVGNCSVHDFQKNAMALNAQDAGTQLTVNVHDNVVVGYGATTVTAQNGIQVWAPGSSGSVTDNNVSGIAYDNTASSIKWVATSILNYYTNLDISGNTVSQGHVGVYNIDGNSTITENDITIEKIGVYAFGIIASDPPKAVPAPIDDPVAPDATVPSGKGLAATAASVVSVDVLRNELAFSGMDNTATYGIEADGGFGPDDLAFYAAENSVTGFEIGIEIYECQSGCDVGVFSLVKAYSNDLAGNTVGMRSNMASMTADGSGNWWGSNIPATVAGSVSGVVDYSPWLDGGEDTDLGTDGFQGDFSALWVDDDSPQAGADHHLQEGVNMVSGSTVYLAPGTYVGQTVVSGYADLDIIGSGIGVSILNPPATPMTHSYVTGPNNYAIMSIENSDDVDVSDLTVDGLGLGNSNYRFVGIGFFESGGSVANCEVKDIRESPINGMQHGNAIYAYNFADPSRTVEVSGTHVLGFQKGGIVMNGDHLTANVTGNDVDGYGPASFIAMNGIQLGFGAVGSVIDNEVYGSSYTGPSWAATGILLYHDINYGGAITTSENLVEDCQVGIYYINVGGNCDENTVTASAAGTGVPAFWNIVLDPGGERRIKTQPAEEPVQKSSYRGMAAGVAAITTSATGNVVDGAGDGVGIEADAYSPEALNVTLDGNLVTNFETGVVLWEESGATLSSTLTSNRIFYNELGLYNENGAVDAQGNSICFNTISADDNTAGNYYDQNSWSDWNGVAPYNVGGAGANVDNNPAGSCGLDMTPHEIAYDCDGEFSFDVSIGEAIKGMGIANIRIRFPWQLTVTNVVLNVPDWEIIGWTQSNNLSGTDLFNIAIYDDGGGTIDGPASLFTVFMSGTESCLDGELVMQSTTKLWEPGYVEIPASLSAPIHLKTDCVDPSGVTVNSPAPGGCYNAPPVLDITAADDCDLDAIYYQVDGCGGTWLPIAAGLSGTSYNNPAWAVPGFAGLTDGVHCIFFQVVDDFGRTNADACMFSWCFTKDVTPPSITCPAAITVDCRANIPACDISSVTTSDNLGGLVTVTCSDGPFSGDDCAGTMVRTYRATDECGNYAECTQVITVDDTTPPTITCLPDIMVQRFLDLPPCDPGDVTVGDNCGGPVTVSCQRSSVGGVGCTDTPIPVTYTFTAVDVCGNESQCVRVVTVLRPDCPFFVTAGDADGVVDVFSGQQVALPVSIDSVGSEIGALDLAISYDPTAVTVLGVERGEAIAEWEYFTYRLETEGSEGAGVIRLTALADLNNGPSHPSLEAYMPTGPVAHVKIAVGADPVHVGKSFVFEPCLNGCTDNTIVSRLGDMTFVMAESDFEACASQLTGSVLPGVRFAGVRLDVSEPRSVRGDVNLNGISHEVGDAVLLVNYFVNGPSALSDDLGLRALQTAASDINNDGVVLTVADLTYLMKVIAGSSLPASDAKLSPYLNIAEATYRVESGRLSVTTNSAVDLGGAYFVFRQTGSNVGAPVLSDAAESMAIRSSLTGDEYRVLVWPSADQMAPIRAGDREIFSASVSGDGALELVEVQLADDFGALLSTTVHKNVVPVSYALGQNYPNPFNAGTVIPFDLKDASEWTVTIYNIMGQMVRAYSGHSDAGSVRVPWDGADNNGISVASGIYFYRVHAANWTDTRKMTLVK